MRMQIGQLRAFLAVAEQRHFTRAAKELGLAQPSVSAHIQRLESELATELFHRMKGKVTLTPAGEALLPYARRIVADVGAATEELRAVGSLARGHLAIGATPSLSATLLPAALSPFPSASRGRWDRRGDRAEPGHRAQRTVARDPHREAIAHANHRAGAPSRPPPVARRAGAHRDRSRARARPLVAEDEPARADGIALEPPSRTSPSLVRSCGRRCSPGDGADDAVAQPIDPV